MNAVGGSVSGARRFDRRGFGRGVFAIAAAMTLGSCGDSGSGGSDSAEPQIGYVRGNGTITTIEVADRVAAPEVSGTTLSDAQLSLSDFAGKLVVLNVWGSWCPPCRKEAPELAAAARELADQNVEFLGINTRDNDIQAARAFERRFEVPYPSLYDPAGKLLLGFRGSLPPNAIPSTLVIDSDGRVAARIIGETTKNTLVGLVEDVRAAAA